MWYTDTRDSSLRIDFRQAVIQGMSEKTGGLYIPTEFPKLPDSFLNRPSVPTFRETAFEMAKPYTEGTIPPSVLEEIIVDAYPFDVPVKPLDPNTYVLELFHGPTCAFKDVGARFMARVMGYFNKDEDKALHILVATSGDTGSAVGSAFHNIPGIDVIRLSISFSLRPTVLPLLSLPMRNLPPLALAAPQISSRMSFFQIDLYSTCCFSIIRSSLDWLQYLAQLLIVHLDSIIKIDLDR